MEIRALTPELADDFFDFFDHRAFSDNPYWKSCYCIFFHRPEKLPEEAEIRTRRRDQARMLIREGRLRGYLAYDDSGHVIGWCNANHKTAYQRLGEPKSGDEHVLSIVCFVVDPRHRRQGIARSLLTKAIEEAARDGFRVIEAYPSSRAKSESGHYHGPLALYESFGFEKVPGRKLIVRKNLDIPR
jgi:ribosomal protein S18 acetylase RimI-like enzyme